MSAMNPNGAVPTRDWPMVIIGNGNQPGGGVWASSQMFNVKVEEAFVKGTIEGAKSQRSQTVDLRVNLEHLRDWQGTGELKLLGLPAHATAEPTTITPGQEEAAFKVAIAESTPLGNHKSLICELTIQVNGEPVIHRFGQGGRLRIFQPKKENAQANAD